MLSSAETGLSLEKSSGIRKVRPRNKKSASFQLMPGSLASHVTAWSLRFPCSPASHFPSSPALLCCQQTLLQARRPSCAGPQLGDPAAGEGRRGEGSAARVCRRDPFPPRSAAVRGAPSRNVPELGRPPCCK